MKFVRTSFSDGRLSTPHCLILIKTTCHAGVETIIACVEYSSQNFRKYTITSYFIIILYEML